MTFVFPSPCVCSRNPTFPLCVSMGDTQRRRLSSRYTPRTVWINVPVPNWQVYSSDSSKHGPVTITDVPPNMCPRFGRRTRSVFSVVEKMQVCYWSAFNSNHCSISPIASNLLLSVGTETIRHNKSFPVSPAYFDEILLTIWWVFPITVGLIMFMCYAIYKHKCSGITVVHNIH